MSFFILSLSLNSFCRGEIRLWFCAGVGIISPIFFNSRTGARRGLRGTRGCNLLPDIFFLNLSPCFPCPESRCAALALFVLFCVIFDFFNFFFAHVVRVGAYRACGGSLWGHEAGHRGMVAWVRWRGQQACMWLIRKGLARFRACPIPPPIALVGVTLVSSV